MKRQMLVAIAGLLLQLGLAAQDLEVRRGLLVPYAEDWFKDMAGLRYEQSPFYRSITAHGDTASFVMPREWIGKRIVLAIDSRPGTTYSPKVKLNGHLLTDNGAGAICQWDITSLLNENTPPPKPARNTRARKSAAAPVSKDSLNRMVLSGLGAGRHYIYLYATPKRVWVNDYTVTTSVTSDGQKPVGVFNLDINLGGITGRRGDIAVEYMLFDDTRHQVAAGRADAAPRLKFRADIPGIKLWTSRHPNRYMVAIILRDDNTGAHILTVGCPLRFTDDPQTERSATPVMAMHPGGIERTVIVDSLPVTPEGRNALLKLLRLTGAERVATHSWEGRLWSDLAEANGLNAAETDRLDITTANAAPHLTDTPEGWNLLTRRLRRVVTEPGDTLPLSINAVSAQNGVGLEAYTLDWELISPEGTRVATDKGIVTIGDPGETQRIVLTDRRLSKLLPAAASEGFLNLTWRAADEVTGVEPGTVVAVEQMVLPKKALVRSKDTRLEKLKGKKKGNTETWKAKNVEFSVDLGRGIVTSLIMDGRQLLAGPIVPMPADYMPKLGYTKGKSSYDKQNRELTLECEVRNTDGTPLGHAVTTLSVNSRGELNIGSRILGQTTSMAGVLKLTLLPMGNGDVVYLGRGPANTGPEDIMSDPETPRARIGLNLGNAYRSGYELHADTRYVVLGGMLRIDSSAPFEFDAMPQNNDQIMKLSVAPEGSQYKLKMF